MGVLHSAVPRDTSAAADLQECGYTAEDAVAALQSCRGDPSAALELLHGRLMGGRHSCSAVDVFLSQMPYYAGKTLGELGRVHLELEHD